ncbi:MEKHLA domain-containing protein [Streptomyces sp. NPDC050528]|uniref:MEKHLA domain-containing protein n=1 Tax=Streptomyces sp. NPDC050528 TaxID=3365623 RepID=UPI00378F40C2
MFFVSSPLDTTFFSLLNGSHERLLGRPLTSGAPIGVELPYWLYHDAPYAVLAQDAADDPAFVYANTAAQQCFGYSWEEFSGLPSRLSAPVADRSARDRLMADVRRRGFAEGYRGLRESRTGRRFWIADVTIWNLHDTDGTVRGQAALIPSWSAA